METVINPAETFSLASKIISLRLDNFLLHPIPAEEVKNLNKEKVTFEFNVEGQINLPDKKFTIIVTSKIFKEEEKKNYLGEIRVLGEFKVENMDDIFKRFKGIPEIVTATYLGIVISAARGMFVIKSAETYLNGVIMPIIDINTFFRKPPPTK